MYLVMSLRNAIMQVSIPMLVNQVSQDLDFLNVEYMWDECDRDGVNFIANSNIIYTISIALIPCRRRRLLNCIIL